MSVVQFPSPTTTPTITAAEIALVQARAVAAGWSVSRNAYGEAVGEMDTGEQWLIIDRFGADISTLARLDRRQRGMVDAWRLVRRRSGWAVADADGEYEAPERVFSTLEGALSACLGG